MIIDINQHKIALGAKYDVFINELSTHQASKEWLTFLAEINISGIGGGNFNSHIQKEWTWFSTSYLITTYDNNILNFKSISLWKGHYACQSGEDLFEVFAHAGRKYSVFKNNIQVAYWKKEMVTWFNGDNYKIYANDDADKSLLISFCLILDNSTSKNTNSNTVTLDLGRIGPEKKSFNSNWRPT